MPVRKADAVWEGNLKEGRGRIKVGSGVRPARSPRPLPVLRLNFRLN